MSVCWRIVQGDCREVLGSLDAGSVQCCLTSPPYLGLRDYGLPATAWPAVTYRTLGGEVRVPAMECVLGLEPSVEAWVGHLVQVFREIRRALRDDGTLWLNLGDAWNTRQRGSDNGWDKSHLSNPGRLQKAQRQALKPKPAFGDSKPKDLLGLPWQVAFALRADGWWLREEVIFSKRTPMPESVRDRCTRSHEQLFRLTKSRRYFADMEAIAEPAVRTEPIPRPAGWAEGDVPHDARSHNGRGGSRLAAAIVTTRNKRSVWTLSSAPFSGWGLGDRRVRVAADDADDDTERITSPDCPVHADPPVPAPTSRDGGRVAERSRHSPDTYVDPSQGQLLDDASTGSSRAPDLLCGSSDSRALVSPEPANGRSSRSSRTDPARATTPACTPSAETAGHTLGTSTQPESSAPHRGMRGCSNAGGDSAGPRGSETCDRTVHRPSPSRGTTCTCEFYRVERIDHFATFPPALVEPAILCATSPTACGECGAPWRRVVERDRRRLSAGPVVNGWAGDDGVKRSTSGDGHRNAYHTAVTTVGFEPTCNHHDDSGRCTVLDPFAGAATTGLVALRHDRSFVGIELSAEYVELGRARILADQPLLNQAAEAS